MIHIENQLDKKWKGCYIGNKKSSSFASYACYLFCWTYIYSVKMGKQISPLEVDKLFVEKSVYFNGDLINSVRAAQVLGLQYFGVETDINKPPEWHPSVKRVDYSAAPGKQYHFVVRTVVDGKKVILDPVGGVQRDIDHYEKKVGDTSWTKGGFEYRKIKI